MGYHYHLGRYEERAQRIEILQLLMEDTDPDVRKEVATGAYLMGVFPESMRIFPELMRILDHLKGDSDSDVSEMAELFLQEIHKEQAGLTQEETDFDP